MRASTSWRTPSMMSSRTLTSDPPRALATVTAGSEPGRSADLAVSRDANRPGLSDPSDRGSRSGSVLAAVHRRILAAVQLPPGIGRGGGLGRRRVPAGHAAPPATGPEEQPQAGDQQAPPSRPAASQGQTGCACTCRAPDRWLSRSPASSRIRPAPAGRCRDRRSRRSSTASSTSSTPSSRRGQPLTASTSTATISATTASPVSAGYRSRPDSASRSAPNGGCRGTVDGRPAPAGDGRISPLPSNTSSSVRPAVAGRRIRSGHRPSAGPRPAADSRPVPPASRRWRWPAAPPGPCSGSRPPRWPAPNRRPRRPPACT